MNDLEVQVLEAGETFDSELARSLGRALAEAENERSSLLFKISIAHLVLVGQFPDKGTQPYQDARLLLHLRNLLVHARPEEVEFGEPDVEGQFPKIVRSFASRGVIPSPPTSAVIAWRQYVLVRDVASWAINTTVRAIKWIPSFFPEGDLKKWIEFPHQHHLEIGDAG